MINSKITTIIGRAIPLSGDDIDTDRIIPARYLRCVTFDGLGENLFEDDRKQNPDHPFNQKRFQKASILLAEKNFGCGSSREHAPQSLNKWGIKGIIGISFAEIFFANCQAIGIPCFSVEKEKSKVLFSIVEQNPSLEIEMNIESATIQCDGAKINANLPTSAKTSFLEGTWNATQVLLQAQNKIDSLSKKLPYLNAYSPAAKQINKP